MVSRWYNYGANSLHVGRVESFYLFTVYCIMRYHHDTFFAMHYRRHQCTDCIDAPYLFTTFNHNVLGRSNKWMREMSVLANDVLWHIACKVPKHVPCLCTAHKPLSVWNVFVSLDCATLYILILLGSRPINCWEQRSICDAVQLYDQNKRYMFFLQTCWLFIYSSHI